MCGNKACPQTSVDVESLREVLERRTFSSNADGLGPCWLLLVAPVTGASFLFIIWRLKFKVHAHIEYREMKSPIY